ncbi:MAG: hypothetical protein OCD01_14595 [Fibrobacterales bacterium]
MKRLLALCFVMLCTVLAACAENTPISASKPVLEIESSEESLNHLSFKEVALPTVSSFDHIEPPRGSVSSFLSVAIKPVSISERTIPPLSSSSIALSSEAPPVPPSVEARIMPGTINKLLASDSFIVAVVSNDFSFTPWLQTSDSSLLENVTLTLEPRAGHAYQPIIVDFDAFSNPDSMLQNFTITDFLTDDHQSIYTISIDGTSNGVPIETITELTVPGLEEFDGKVPYLLIDTVAPDVSFIVHELERNGSDIISRVNMRVSYTPYEEFVGSKVRWNVYYREGRDDTIEYDLIDSGSVTIEMKTFNPSSGSISIIDTIQYPGTVYQPWTIVIEAYDALGHTSHYMNSAAHRL